jgi:hypothetical protein
MKRMLAMTPYISQTGNYAHIGLSTFSDRALDFLIFVSEGEDGKKYRVCNVAPSARKLHAKGCRHRGTLAIL